MEKKLVLSYYSQYLDTRPDLQLTSCGMVSLYMILLYYKKNRKSSIRIPSLTYLIDLGIKEKGKVSNGWVHDYLVGVAYRYKVVARRKNTITVEFIRERIDMQTPLIISVVRKCLVSVSTHMVVVVGYSDTGIFFLDVARLNRTQQEEPSYCTFDELLEYLRPNGIYFEPF